MKTIERELELLRACKTEEERTELIKRLKSEHKNDDLETSLKNLSDIKDKLNALSIEAKLLEVKDRGISLTYISEKFLQKSRSYLSQRLHSNTVNGKVQELSKEEIGQISKGLMTLSEDLRVLANSLAVS